MTRPKIENYWKKGMSELLSRHNYSQALEEYCDWLESQNESLQEEVRKAFRDLSNLAPKRR